MCWRTRHGHQYEYVRRHWWCILSVHLGLPFLTSHIIVSIHDISATWHAWGRDWNHADGSAATYCISSTLACIVHHTASQLHSQPGRKADCSLGVWCDTSMYFSSCIFLLQVSARTYVPGTAYSIVFVCDSRLCLYARYVAPVGETSALSHRVPVPEPNLSFSPLYFLGTFSCARQPLLCTHGNPFVVLLFSLHWSSCSYSSTGIWRVCIMYPLAATIGPGSYIRRVCCFVVYIYSYTWHVSYIPWYLVTGTCTKYQEQQQQYHSREVFGVRVPYVCTSMQYINTAVVIYYASHEQVLVCIPIIPHAGRICKARFAPIQNWKNALH